MTTPMMAQWESCKAKAPGALLLFRLGDFYEAFYQDAETVSKTIGLTLTQRQGIPMCGAPAVTLETTLDKLVSRGFKVAIADQLDEAKGTGLVRRDIVRIVTPGTVYSPHLLKEKESRYLACITQVGSTFGLSAIEVSTGHFKALEVDSLKELENELSRFKPPEILLSKKFSKTHSSFLKDLSFAFSFLLTEKDDAFFDLKTAQEDLQRHFSLHSLDVFGLTGKVGATIAAGTLLTYLKIDLAIPLSELQGISTHILSGTLSLDRATMRNLELVEPAREGATTLLDLLDQTETPMGGRSLCQWVQYPLTDLTLLLARQESVSTLMARPLFGFTKIRDLERLTIRLSSPRPSPRDLLSLAHSLTPLSALKERLETEKGLLFSLGQEITPLDSLSSEIISSLVETPPVRLSEAPLIRSGVDAELDEWRGLSQSSEAWVTSYQQRLREETGIKTLKITYTDAFGYAIEVSRSQSSQMPPHFQRRQTLVNSERYISEELKTFESKALHAEERARKLEFELFDRLRKKALLHLPAILRTAQSIGSLDALQSLARVALENKWHRPLLDSSEELKIIGGRHPIVEQSIGQARFIPNDTDLGTTRMLLLTGPNMAGKSTYIRQVALIALLAHIGSFVPAQEARIGLIDQIFSRIGASDDLARGQSTFMVEMAETAHILQHATRRSLVLLDEIGRGTSTYDGISIAWAVAEHLALESQAKTLFATHYSELTALEKELPGVKNGRVEVAETSSGITFLHKIVPGSTDKSYGIHVARLAGLPLAVIQKASRRLLELEEERPPTAPKKEAEQLPLFSLDSASVALLKTIDPSRLTPLEALQTLYELKKLTESCPFNRTT